MAIKRPTTNTYEHIYPSISSPNTREPYYTILRTHTAHLQYRNSMDPPAELTNPVDVDVEAPSATPVKEEEKEAIQVTATGLEKMTVKTSSDDHDDDGDNESLPDLFGSRDKDGGGGAGGGGDSDTASEDGDADGSGVASPKAADELLLEATALKDQGNAHFAAAELDDAARCYRRGTNKLKKLNPGNSGDAQVQGLLISLQTNLSTVCFKQNKYAASRNVATKVLDIDASNVKALYRRAVANRKTGDTDEAIADLRRAAKLDPANVAVKKEWAAAKKELERAKKTQKAAFQKAFSKSGSSFLYNDKQDEENLKIVERERAEKEKEQLLKKRKMEWEDACVKRLVNNELAVSFDEWEAEQTLQAEAEQKVRDEQDKRHRQERKTAQAAARKLSQSQESDDSDDDELTAQELASLRGYKKTADGRTTSYFTRELSQVEKEQIGDIAPKPIAAASSSSAAGELKSSTEGASRSAWNQAGTWEEKDTTTWCTTQLRKRLEDMTVSASKFDADIVAVDELTGDASVAMAGGKKRYIFDYHAKLKYEIKDPGEDKVVASGVVRLPDICSTSHDELEVTFETWKKAPSKAAEEYALASRAALLEELRATVQRWVADFNEMY